MSDRWRGAKAIETTYAGVRFRSRLEARWAVFMDALDVEWHYEAEGFDLGPDGYYLPDFWLPNINAWLEVKGRPPELKVFDQAQGLARATGYPVCVAIGWVDAEAIVEGAGFWTALPEATSLKGHPFTSGTMWAVCLECDLPGLDNGLGELNLWCGHSAPGTTAGLEHAYTQARTWRLWEGPR